MHGSIYKAFGMQLWHVTFHENDVLKPSSLQARAQVVSGEYQKLQGDQQSAVEARQRLEAQLSENEMVKKEFARLTPKNTVYKLIGRVLVPQDQAEAKSNVDTLLEFIRGEICRASSRQLKEIGTKTEKKKQEKINTLINYRDLGWIPKDPKEAADRILAYAEEMGSEDNATAIVVPLAGWGKITDPDKTTELREYRQQNAVGSERQRRMYE
ncbi:hypothetical protein FIBSPDRAFT_1056108 [Athelia psychrophila]|uniref:Prefoldin beta-like protein n=1 Tax=Athelia psychrophila TaxID=1759441 RepID=A0A167SMK3_9AGAM|nr:hypothetical protein FIBSPDRAFT_1056108 [Fibularhizoctonia sp. CBS 109695]